jgi:dTDP-4-dehydrorhamnose reductase
MNIAISGACGMLGSALARELSGEHALFGFDRFERAHHAHFFKKYAALNILDAGGLKKFFGEVRPDAVIHAAAYTDVDKAEQETQTAEAVNVTGTKNVADACRGVAKNFFYISTDYIFDGTKQEPYAEEDTASPLNEYGKTKLRGEQEVQEALESFYIVRTSWLYGDHGRNFVDTILNLAQNNSILDVVSDQRGRPTYTRDLARGLAALLKAAPPFGVYHVANDGECSWYEFAVAIVKAKGLKAQIKPISSQALHRKAPRPAYSVLDTRKFQTATGVSLRSWREAMKEYVG